MAEICTDESRTGQGKDMMSVRIVYRKIDSSSSSVNLSFDSKKFELSCDDLVYDIQTSVSILKKSTFLKTMLETEWKDANMIIIEVTEEKLFYAFGSILRFIHLPSLSSPTLSIDQMRHLLRPNSEMDIELCIACGTLGLTTLQEHVEEFLLSGLNCRTFIPSCQYASQYKRSKVSDACYAFIKRNGVELTDLKDVSKMSFDDQVLFNPSTKYFYYDNQKMNIDFFDNVISKDFDIQYKYLSPGYLSAGRVPCCYDTMTEEEFHEIGKRKKNSGFEGTIRCYMDKILDETTRSFQYYMYREDTGDFLLSAVMIPDSNSVALFSCKQVTPSNMTRYLYSSYYVGIMEGNSMGTDFIMYDNGADPDLLPSEVLDDISRKVVCKITYESNIAGKKPNAMQVSIPATRKDIWKTITSTENISKQELAKMKLSSSAHLVTRNAKWNEELEGWTLKFNGRAKKASKRNFQLIFREDQGDSNVQVLVCFGKMSSTRFSIDYAPPLSSVQAFAAALTCFMKKRLVA